MLKLIIRQNGEINRSFKTLDNLYETSPKFKLRKSDNYVIFSDLHLGNGNGNDDFIKNAALFKYILANYYMPSKFKLILNGDVEELYKFKVNDIFEAWKDLYELFEKFYFEGNLIKLVGNHDWEILNKNNHIINSVLYEAIRLIYNSNTIFIFHGHQTANYLEQYNPISMFFVRYIAKLLGIKNPTLSVNGKKISTTEQRSYQFSIQKRIISIIGHTHKPLFESMSRKDTLKYYIEKLIRKYPFATLEKKQKIRKLISKFKKELQSLDAEKYNTNLINDHIFKNEPLVPCLFNSGTVIGKRGITGIEISNGKISLVYWFDVKRSQRYLKYKGVKTENLAHTDYYKAILKSESLDYIFNRIKLLA